VTCPSAEALADYAAETLPLSDQQAVEEHLRECSYCAEEVRATQAFLARTAPDLAAWAAASSFRTPVVGPEPDATGALPRLIAQLLPASVDFNAAFPLLGSSEEQGAFQVFRANGVTISVRQEATPDTRVVMGAIQQNVEMAPGEDALFARLIWEGDGPGEGAPEHPPQSDVVRGTFEFDHAEPGSYHIEVFFPTVVVVVGPIKVEVL
jgi:putative zinc finger protein